MSDANDAKQDKSPEYQRFDDLANKLFRVPIEKVRELQTKKKQSRSKDSDKPASEP